MIAYASATIASTIVTEYQQISGFSMVDNNVISLYNGENNKEVNQCQKSPTCGDSSISVQEDGIENGAMSETVNNTLNMSIDGYGSKLTGQSLMDMKSTIETITPQTTNLIILNSLPLNGTETITSDSEKTTRSLTALSIDGVESVSNTRLSTTSTLDEQEPIMAIASHAVLKSSENGERQSQNTYKNTDKSGLPQIMQNGSPRKAVISEGHISHVSHSRYFQQFPPDSLFAEEEVT
jgi:hypothetical protein